MVEYVYVLQHYAVFSGRASRREYWMFYLFNIIIAFLLAFIDGLVGISRNSERSILVDIYNVAVFLPSLAVAVRRAHDTNKSGWWILVPFYGFILMLLAGDKESNRYGPDPYSSHEQDQVN